MKRIVLFINNLSSGGAEHQLVQLADGLVERGYDVSIVTFGDNKDHYRYSALIKRKHLAPGKTAVFKMVAIFVFFLKIKTDWIISFGQRENKLCLIPLLFRSHKIHVIAGERNTTIGKPTRQEKILLKVLYRRADYIVPNSHAQYRHIIESEPILEAKTITITNFTDLKYYKVHTLPMNERLRIGIFARYNSQKNCLRFVDAVSKLKGCTSQTFLIEWYGDQKIKDKDNPMFIQMNLKVQEYGLNDCIILHNHIENVAEKMQFFDAICLPSLWEGFSNSISEAISCGKPCLVSDVADNSIMVKEGINGFLFDPKDENSIVESFLKFFSLSHKERECFGLESRKRAEQLFDRSTFLDSYIKLIEL